MIEIPKTGFLRLPQIVGDKKANPPIQALIPISRASWWAGVKSGIYPKAIKLGPKTTVWRAEDIRNLIEQTGHSNSIESVSGVSDV